MVKKLTTELQLKVIPHRFVCLSNVRGVADESVDKHTYTHTHTRSRVGIVIPPTNLPQVKLCIR
jgi:hypothetical protein